jgi:hypothetical protein
MQYHIDLSGLGHVSDLDREGQTVTVVTVAGSLRCCRIIENRRSRSIPFAGCPWGREWRGQLVPDETCKTDNEFNIVDRSETGDPQVNGLREH